MYTIQSGNTLITAGRVRMEPLGKSFVKQCFIRTPHLFKGKPIVTVTVYSTNGNEAFPVYGIEEDEATGETIFKVSATNNQVGKDSEPKIKYWCDFMMMGELK